MALVRFPICQTRECISGGNEKTAAPANSGACTHGFFWGCRTSMERAHSEARFPCRVRIGPFRRGVPARSVSLYVPICAPITGDRPAKSHFVRRSRFGAQTPLGPRPAPVRRCLGGLGPRPKGLGPLQSAVSPMRDESQTRSFATIPPVCLVLEHLDPPGREASDVRWIRA